MRTYGEYVARDYETYGGPFDFDPTGTAPAKPKNLATPKQLNYIATLADERGMPEVLRTAMKVSSDGTPIRDADGVMIPIITKREASDLISKLLDTPKPRRTSPAVEITEGMYRTPDGEIYKVQRAVHGSGHLYAKRLVVEVDAQRDGQGNILVPAVVYFDMARGAVRKLRPEWKMSLDEAKQFGALYGTCCVCGRTLTNEASIEAGIGPICAGKF